MGLKKLKPVINSMRNTVLPDYKEVTTSKPEPSLIERLPRTGGRNNQGRITARHRGGGHRRFYRRIDFKRNKTGVPATVKTIEYDPNRTARIALVNYADGEKRYIIATENMKVGMQVVSGPDVEPNEGNAMPLSAMPLGSTIHNIELIPGRGAQMARSAGQFATLQAKESGTALLQLPSGEVRKVSEKCYATMGRVGNVEHGGVKLGKAGRNRWRGWRPFVRGSCMNPVDHPMGGGEGRRSGGRDPQSPTGVLSKGGKTRKKRKASSKLILRRRKTKRKK